MADAEGVFERATAYQRGGQLIHKMHGSKSLARARDAVFYPESGVAFLRELGNLPDEGQQWLLGVLDSNPEIGGRIQPAGAGGEELGIGCAMVFTTNAAIESRVVRSDACGPGDFREDLFRRLFGEHDSWLEVPSLERMGAIAFFEHLDVALKLAGGRSVSDLPETKAHLDAVAEGSMDMDTIKRIVSAFKESGDSVLMPGHILPLLRARAERPCGTKITGGGKAWALDKFVSARVVGRSTREYRYLELGMEHEGEEVKPAVIRGRVGAADGSELSDHAISSGLSRLRGKLDGRRDCGWVPGRPNLFLKRTQRDG